MFGVRDPSEQKLDRQERGLVVASLLVIRNGLPRAVFQQKAVVVTEHCVPDRRFDADARRAARDDKIFDPSIPQNPVEVSFEETTITMFWQDDVTLLRRQTWQYFRVPCVFDEDAARPAVRRFGHLAHAKRAVFDPVGRVGTASIREVRSVLHLKIDDGDCGQAGGCQRTHRRGDRPLDRRDVDAGAVEHAALRTEIVLHVDYQQGAFIDVDPNRFRSCLDSDGPIFVVHGHPVRTSAHRWD